MRIALAVGLIAALAAFPAWSPAEEAQAAGGRPNILFIAVDDMRYELGCFGTQHVQTPHMDRLASSGMLFTRAYCQQAVCNPSRVSLLTGLRPDSTRVWDLVTEMRTVMPDVVTLPQHFRRNGYRAVAYGKIFHNPFPDAASWDEPTHNAQGVVAYSEENRERLRVFRQQGSPGCLQPGLGGGIRADFELLRDMRPQSAEAGTRARFRRDGTALKWFAESLRRTEA